MLAAVGTAGSQDVGRVVRVLRRGLAFIRKNRAPLERSWRLRSADLPLEIAVSREEEPLEGSRGQKPCRTWGLPGARVNVDAEWQDSND
ncbi:hypothetical protein NDU88_005871 [Pleurodeles waltl]|uniref:Uncharacterized protein n=1 Tax=Pleurodeles waltl TaxID=8319 RepID=A0AAV7VK98_PLEWA|nr:hypothetical protein NDU88_005871 [Pleurodeles waltl]